MSKRKPSSKRVTVEDAYQLKKAKIVADSQPKYLEVVNEVYTDIRDDIVGETKSILSTIKSILTPDFLLRIQHRKIHQDIINQSIENYEGVRTDIEQAVVQVLDEAVLQKDVFKNVKSKLRKEKHLRDKVKVAHDAAEEQKKEAVYNDYNDRQRIIYESKKAAVESSHASEEMARQQELQEYRNFQETHWKQQAVAIKNVLIERTSLHQVEEIKNKTLSVEQLTEEWNDRDLARARMQVELPYESSTTTAIQHGKSVLYPSEAPPYKTLFISSTTNNNRDSSDGSNKEMSGDFHDVHLFESDPIMKYELDTAAYHEKSAQLQRQQQLYDSMQFEYQRIGPAMSKIVELRELAQREFQQVANELRAVELDQLGPPRRLPIAAEVKATHMRKQRQTDLSNSITSFQSTLDTLMTKRRDIEVQMIILAKKLAIDRESVKAFGDNFTGTNHGLGHLPVVIGNRINPPAGFNLSNPMEIYNGIVNKSKFTYIQEKEKTAMSAHRDRYQLEQKVWLVRQDREETKNELNFTLSKLAAVSSRLQNAFSSATKSNVVEALSGFFHSGIALNIVNTIIEGSLNWFEFSNPQSRVNVIESIILRDSGCIYFETVNNTETNSTVSNVVLGESKSGSIEGIINLPKAAPWVISFKVTNESQDNNNGLLAYDYVNIRLGSSELALSLVGTYYNTINPHTNAIIYDVRHLHYGSTLAYKFEFVSSTTDVTKHLVVNSGMFSEFQMEPIESYPDPKSSGRIRVVSDYVKRLRVEESQGKLRLTKLLEELINVEGSSDKIWDAKVMFPNSKQRYNREMFARLLRAEILVEHRLISRHARNNNTRSAYDDKLQLSQDGYLFRKKSSHSELVDRCNSEVGKRLDVFDPHLQSWRKVKVLKCNIKWIDNGTYPQVTHLVQEFNEENVLVGEPYECNLLNMRYFVSSVQTSDDATKLSLNDKKMWEDRIDAVRNEKQTEVAEAEVIVSAYKKDREVELQAIYNSEWAKVFDTEMSIARLFINSSQAKQAIVVEVERVDIDIRKGNITLPSSKNVRGQRLEIAKKRIVDRLVRNKKVEFDESFQIKVNALETDINDKMKSVLILRQKADRAIADEIKLYKAAMAEMKRSLLSRVKFDDASFALAVPKVTSCEHIKSKAWGNFYGKGVRCVACNKDLTRLHLEESQYAGYGSGINESLNEALNRHRTNETTFRFRNAEELRMVEEERIRLEKERRIMELNEVYFYDYNNLSVLHDFDRRHNIKNKSSGGEGGTLLGLIRKDGSPLSEDYDPPPTFRAADERRHANYEELFFVLGRIQIFHRKIDSLKAERLLMMNERFELSKDLVEIHSESFTLEDDMDRLEIDLNRTNDLLALKETVVGLWIEAKKILDRAIKDKRSAEMRLAGKWDDVKEASDAHSFIHDDTRSLLKLKFLCDLQLNTQSEEVEKCNDKLAEISRQRIELENVSSFFVYCRPGDKVNTKYGDGIIRGFRLKDKMLLVNLNFCSPPAKLWLLAEEIVFATKAKQHAELLLMREEDAHMEQYIAEELFARKKELFCMRLEDVRSQRAFTDLKITSKEGGAIDSNVDLAVRKGMILLETPQYKLLHSQQMETEVKARYKLMDDEYRSYDGPPSGAPPKPSSLVFYRMKKELHVELKEQFLTGIARKTAKDVRNQFVIINRLRLESSTLDIIVEDTLKELILEIAKESILEGKNAKSNAQRASGLIISNPQWMQFDTYSSLIDIKKLRRQELKNQLLFIKGALAKIEANRKDQPAEVEAVVTKKDPESLTQEEKIRLVELERQKELCEEMFYEEECSKEFYRWELLENLRERRQMREEDESMRELMRLEELMYVPSVGGMKEDGQKQLKITSFEKRRQELKALTIERGKQAEEQAWMTLEDARGKLLQEVDRADRLRMQYEKEFGIVDEPDDVDQEDGVEGGVGVTNFEVVKIPPWMEIPAGWENWMLSSQKDFVYRAKKVRALQKRINKKLLIDRKLMEKFQLKTYSIWEEEYYRATQKTLEIELKEMEADEELKVNELEVFDLRSNQRRLFIICREKGEKEIKAKRLLQKRQALAIRYDRELKEAEIWLRESEQMECKKAKLKKKMEADVQFIDVDSLNGFWQRVETKTLRNTLYDIYFSTIIDSLITRAESIVTERRLFRVQERLTLNKLAILERSRLMRELIGDIRRESYMRMKKSALNKLLFGRTTKQLLESVFGGWVRFFLWNRGHREAFELKYEVLKTRLELDREFRKNEGQVSSEANIKADIAPTLMQLHRERPVQCRNCSSFYIESQNTSTICRYHVGEFVYRCPKTCENPGKSQLCIVHKVRRWTCCDVIQENVVGCCQKYHMPLDEDPVYNKILDNIRAKNLDTLDSLQVEVESAAQHNWVEKHDRMRKKHYGAIQTSLQEERQNVQRYAQLKFE